MIIWWKKIKNNGIPDRVYKKKLLKFFYYFFLKNYFENIKSMLACQTI